LKARLPRISRDGKRFKWLTKLIEKGEAIKVMHLTLPDPEHI
jgi:hypothetical protein